MATTKKTTKTAAQQHNPKLKLMMGRAPHGRGSIALAAYSQKQAIEIIEEVFQTKLPSGEISRHFSSCWTDAMSDFTATEPCLFYFPTHTAANREQLWPKLAAQYLTPRVVRTTLFIPRGMTGEAVKSLMTKKKTTIITTKREDPKKEKKAKGSRSAGSFTGDKIKQIIALHVAGKTNKEIIEAGFNKSTVNRQVGEYKKSILCNPIAAPAAAPQETTITKGAPVKASVKKSTITSKKK